MFFSELLTQPVIHQTGHAETVEVAYDANRISLKELLLHFFFRI
ncbi:hypothetical protein CBF97_09525, partial [Streptococcus pyogenes]